MCKSCWVFVVLFAAVTTLSGCAQQFIKESEMVPITTNRAADANNEFRNNVAVRRIKEPPTRFDWALEKTIQNASWLRPSISQAGYVVTPTLVEEVTPRGFQETSGSIYVRYVVTRSTDGATVLDEKIFSSASMGINEKFIGAARVAAVAEEYVKKNIQSFMYRLEAVGAKTNRDRYQKEAASRAVADLQFLASRFSNHDIFADTPFTDKFPPAKFGNYLLSDVVAHADANVLPRLRAATSKQIEQFLSNYASILRYPMEPEIKELLATKKVQEQKTANPIKPASSPPAVPKKGVDTATRSDKLEKKEDLANPF